MLGAHLLPLARTRLQRFQLGALVLEVGALGLARGVALLRLGGERLETLPVAERDGRLPRERSGAAVLVDESALGGGAQQRLVLVLAVDVDQGLARLAQLRLGDGLAVDEAAPAPGLFGGPAKDDAPGTPAQLSLGTPRGTRPCCINCAL